MSAHRPFIIFIAAALLLVSFSGQGSAQQPAGPACPALVERALEALDDNCDRMDRNSACYGFTLVDAEFAQEVEPDFFRQPSDRAELTLLQRLQTVPLDLENDLWGIAVMNVQANVPNSLPGQAVTFLLVGDAEIENRVPPEEALTPVDPVSVAVAMATQPRSGPGPTFSELGLLPSGRTVEADALNRDGSWVRILFENRPAWVPRDILRAADALDGLPVVTARSRSPMQAFYFSTGIGAPVCNDAPDMITVRSPQDIEVDFNVNGIDVRIGSTITFRSLPDNRIAITVHEGQLELVTGQIIQPGQTIVARTDDDGNIIGFEEIREADETELNHGQVSERILSNLLTLGELIHIVQPGETLFSIARLYDTSMQGIINRNGLTDPASIFVGQRLVIPNPGSGFVGLPQPPATPTGPDDDPPPAGVDCAPFRPTSPLDGLAFGSNTFYWDAAPGATGYRVTVFNNTEGGSASFTASAPATSLTATIDQSNLGGGFSFSWQVDALLNGQVACAGQRVTTRREAPPPPEEPDEPEETVDLTADWFCDGNFNVVVTYAGALTGEQVGLSYFGEDMTGPFSLTGTGPAGQFPTGEFEVNEAVVSTVTSGQEVFLPSLIFCTIP
jgi:LysM repeat protein